MKLIAYYRRSTEQQSDNTSLETQKMMVHQMAKMKGATIEVEYQEIGSGSKDTRVVFNKALEQVKARGCDGLIVYDIDRYFRSAELGLRTFRQNFLENGKVLLSASQGIDTSTDEGWFMLGQFLLMAEYELMKITRRLTRGKEQAKANKQFAGGKVPYGYDIIRVDDKSYLTKNEFEQEWINRMAIMYNRGEDMSLQDVANALNLEEVPLKSGKIGRWTAMQVSRVLKYVPECQVI